VSIVGIFYNSEENFRFKAKLKAASFF